MRLSTILAYAFVGARLLAAQAPATGQYSPIAGPSVTVSKPIIEIELEKQIDDGARATAALNHMEAIKILEDALRKIRSNPSLKKMESDCLVRLGYAYLGPLRLDDALRSFTPALDPAMNCKSRMAMESCADAQYGVGTVQMYKSDFAAAVSNLGKALATYGKAVAGDHPEEFRMKKIVQKAKVEGLLGAALFRTGDKPKAIETLRHSVSQLTIVAKNEKLSQELRNSAHGALLDAQKSLDLLQQN